MRSFFRKKRNLYAYFGHNFMNVLAIVLIWRGFWYIFDYIDLVVFLGDHKVTVLGGIIAGFSILYFPDRNLDELEKL